MQFEIIGNPGRQFTDTPRALTDDEKAEIRGAYSEGGRLKAVTLYREVTDATLSAAVREVEVLCGAKAGAAP